MVETLRRAMNNPADLLVPLIIFLVTLAVGWAARRIVRGVMRGWIARTSSRPARILADAVHGPFMMWVVILAVHLAVQSSDLPDRHARVEAWVSRLLIALVVLSFTVMASRLSGSLIRTYGAGIPSALPVTTLTQNLAQLAVVILGILVLLNQLGIPITPILTALGVGGLAVALALQDTLSNLFAGFYVSIAGQVRLGDYIKLNTGEEGYVSDISWRSTTIRALANNLIIVPNNKLAQAIVTNFHLPEKRLSTSVPVAVGYDCDIDHVETLLRDVAVRASQEVPGMLPEPAPSVMFDPGYTEHGAVFTVGCHVGEFVNQFPVRHELRKRIVRALRENRVPAAFPGRTIVVEQAEPVRRGAAPES
jgi:small-conductance mechanosensitive channel